MKEQVKSSLDSMYYVVAYGAMDRGSATHAAAWELFHKALLRARLGRVWSKIVGTDSSMGRPADASLARVTPAARESEVLDVPIRRIMGSVRPCKDYDSAFRPLRCAMRGRWIAAARAAQTGTPIAPVELTRIGDRYYVLHGHLQVSVARALRRDQIAAVAGECQDIAWSQRMYTVQVTSRASAKDTRALATA